MNESQTGSRHPLADDPHRSLVGESNAPDARTEALARVFALVGRHHPIARRNRDLNAAMDDSATMMKTLTSRR